MPLQKSVVETIINCSIHLGTFYVWHDHDWYYLLLSRWMERNLWVWFLIWAWYIFLAAWNFCLSQDKLFFPWAEFLVVLGIMGLWMLDFRTLPIDTDTLFPEQAVSKLEKLYQTLQEHWRQEFSHRQTMGLFKCSWDFEKLCSSHFQWIQRTALNLQAVCKLWNNKVTLLHKISSKGKFTKCSYTPETLKSCTQVTSRVKHTVLVSGTVQSLVKL